MVTDTTKLGSRTMRPPAPSYVPGPIPLHRLLRAVLFNPLQIWSREHFEEPLVVSRTPLGTRVVVSDPEAIKWILVDNSSNYVRDSLQQRILLRTTGRSLFSSEGADWRLLRKTFAPFFSRRALGAFLSGMIAAADKLVERLEVQEAVVLLARLAQHLHFKRAGDQPVRLRQCITLQPQGGLRVRVQKRKASVTEAR